MQGEVLIMHYLKDICVAFVKSILNVDFIQNCGLGRRDHAFSCVHTYVKLMGIM